MRTRHLPPAAGPVRSRPLAALLLAGLVLGGLGSVHWAPGAVVAQEEPKKEEEPPKEEPKKEVEKKAVYYGNCRDWDAPAEVDPDRVYAEIEEYKKILADGLQPGDAKYGVLMSKASERFRRAVRAAAVDGGYDLVARVGAVKGVASVPLITTQVIAKL